MIFYERPSLTLYQGHVLDVLRGLEATVPATVLDCFGGSGTTGIVANELGRRAVLVELNPEYAAMAVERLRQEVLL